jgi:hypothetical protein
VKHYLPNRSAESADGGSRRPALPLQAPSTSYSGFPICSWSIPWIARFSYLENRVFWHLHYWIGFIFIFDFPNFMPPVSKPWRLSIGSISKV